MSALPQPSPPPEPPPAPAAPPPIEPAPAGHGFEVTPEVQAQLAAAREAYRPLGRAVRVATFSATTLAVFAVVALPFALFSSKAAFAAVGLGVCAFFEFRGRDALRSLDPAGPRNLARNQIAYTALLTAYCAWSAYSTWFAPGGGPYAAALARHPEIAPMLEPYAELLRQATTAFYGVVWLVGVLYQALLIRYYHTRRRPLERYLAETPGWVLELEHARNGRFASR